MKQITAKLRYLKVAPRKVRLVADAVKGLPVQEAEAQLLMRPQRSSPALLKLLRSAVANAKNNNLKTDSLVISSIRVDQGPMLKRTLPRAMGRATILQKKMSHVSLILEEAADLRPARFNIVQPKKSKDKTSKSKKVVKKSALKIDEKKQLLEKRRPDKAGQSEQSKSEGFLKKMFRRKSV